MESMTPEAAKQAADEFRREYQAVRDQIGRVVVGQRDTVDGVPGADVIGEFAFGTSDRAPLGSPSEKGRKGTVHFALGDNKNAYPGGQNVSRLHLDGIVLNATMQVIDTGEYILKDGKWQL